MFLMSKGYEGKVDTQRELAGSLYRNSRVGDRVQVGNVTGPILETRKETVGLMHGTLFVIGNEAFAIKIRGRTFYPLKKRLVI